MPKARSEIRSIGTKGCSRSLSDATGQTSSHCCSISGSIPTSAAASTWIHLKTRGAAAAPLRRVRKARDGGDAARARRGPQCPCLRQRDAILRRNVKRIRPVQMWPYDLRA